MKRLLLAGVLLVLFAGGYYFRGFFFKAQDLTGRVYEYRLSSGNPDELYRFVPVVEAQMRRLPGVEDVNSDLQVEVSETLDRQKAEGCDQLRDDRTKFSACMERAKVMLLGITISFKLAPGAALGQAIDQIQDMERQLALPATIKTGFSKRPDR
jgi:multidrug efflux pump subunit AcrB